MNKRIKKKRFLHYSIKYFSDRYNYPIRKMKNFKTKDIFDVYDWIAIHSMKNNFDSEDFAEWEKLSQIK